MGRLCTHGTAYLFLAALLSGIQACSGASLDGHILPRADETDGGKPLPRPRPGDVDDAATNDEEAGEACNSLLQRGTTSDIYSTPTAAPAPEGGAFEDGIWVSTSTKVWGSPDADGGLYGQAGALTFEKRGARLDAVGNGPPPNGESRYSMTLTLSGTEWSVTPSCPGSDASNVATYHYTATPTTLRLYADAPFGGGILEAVYTKQ